MSLYESKSRELEKAYQNLNLPAQQGFGKSSDRTHTKKKSEDGNKKECKEDCITTIEDSATKAAEKESTLRDMKNALQKIPKSAINY